jgi:hypothetical protein
MKNVEKLTGQVSGICHYPSLSSTVFVQGDGADTFMFDLKREDADKLTFGMKVTVTRTTEVVIDGE